MEIIETLKHFPDVLDAGLKGLPEAALRFQPSEGEWCIKEVIGHAVYAEDIWFRRLSMIWTMHDPVLVAFNMDAQRATQDAVIAARDIRPYLDQMREMRSRMVDLLSHAVDWTRVGQWSGVGRRSLKQLAEHLVSHDADHIAQIQALKAGAGAAASR